MASIACNRIDALTLSPTSSSLTALAFVLAIGAPAVPAFAFDDMAAEADAGESPRQSGRIVVSATRAPVLIEEVPATATIITAEEIADILATDVRDLVRYEPGVSVRRAPARFGAAIGSTGRGRNEDFVIRGIGGNRVLIQVDGIRAPQGFAFGAQSAGRGDYADVSLVKSAEILRGPASALYGSDGLAGAVSFVTSDPEDILAGRSVGGFVQSLYASEDNQFANTVTLAAQSGNLSGMVAYTRRDFNELENKGTNDAIGPARTAPNPQDGQSDALLAKLVWNNGTHRLRLTGEYVDTLIETDLLQAQGPAFLFGPAPVWTVDALTARDRVRRSRASLDWTYTGTPGDILEHAFVAAYWQDAVNRQFAEELRTPLGFIPAPDRTRLNTFDNRVYGGVAEARSRFDTFGIQHKLTIGGDVSWTRQTGVRDGTVPPAGEVFPIGAFPATDFTLGGVFVADEVRLFDGALTLHPALRFDFFDLNPTIDPTLPGFAPAAQSGNRLSPKLGATVKLTPTLFLYGNYSQGFLAPTPGEVNNFFENFGQGYTSIPNPDLRPETSESWEFGARYVGDIFSLQVAGFRGNYDNFISQQVVAGSFTPADPAVFQFVNFESVRIEGVEARAEMNLDSGFNARLTLAYANGTIMEPGGARTPLDTIDPFNLVAGFGYRAPSGRFGAEAIVTYNARKEKGALELDPVTGGDLFIRPEASTFVDLVAFVNLTESLKLRGGLFNITNENYTLWQDIRGLPITSAAIADAFTRPGRNFSLSASYRF
ncbi:MAG: TonB-dependent receptor [Erythrobacter sp. SCN 62-14]|nr:MAG: TonB-dependent receptor [Erythrobacter sp. SCN 62-14]